MTAAPALEALRRAARPLRTADDLGAVVSRLRDARYVLLGESTHGTQEFYALRAEVTLRLIRDHGFAAVAVEGDWPHAVSVHRYVTGRGEAAETAEDALAGFARFPQWLWRNDVVRDFVVWLRAHNLGLPADARAGFYGLDLYNLHTAIDAVVRHLDGLDPAAAARARARYACFDVHPDGYASYGYAASLGLTASCEDDVVAELLELQAVDREADVEHRTSAEEAFVAEQHARMIVDAERYYRAMVRSHATSWNLRDEHMADTLEALGDFLASRGTPPRIVVWAHNSHVGDARATDRHREGILTLGQLMRERAGDAVRLVGFATDRGTVTAASNWDEPAERKMLRPALDESHERLLRESGLSRCWLAFDDPAVREALDVPRLQRAVGVIYRPETERQSHYYHARLARQFDLLLYVEETSALRPLERSGLADEREPPETWPSAL